MRRRALLRLATLPAIAWPAGARAQAFPTKPVTIIVPFSAGGPLDTLCRILAEHMQGTLGQSVVIEDVTGAGGAIGITRVARSPADGHTLISGNQGSHITLGAMQPVSFDLLRDFAPVAMFATNPQLILVRNSLEVANLRELLAWIRANPGKVTDGGGGYGTVAHISALYFMQLSGTTVQFVPYRGASAALQDLLAGQIDMMIDQPSNSLPQVLAGKVKALAVTAPSRLPAAPGHPHHGRSRPAGFLHLGLAGAVGTARDTRRGDRDAEQGGARGAGRPQSQAAFRRPRPGDPARRAADGALAGRVPEGRGRQVGAAGQGSEGQAGLGREPINRALLGPAQDSSAPRPQSGQLEFPAFAPRQALRVRRYNLLTGSSVMLGSTLRYRTCQ